MGYIILFLVNLAFPFAGAAVVVYFLFSSRRNLLKNLKGELAQRFMLSSPGQVLSGYIWMHASSVGEVRSIVKIAGDLKEYYKRPVLLTTSTAAGRAAALKEPLFDAVLLMPMDFYPFIKKFIKIYTPKYLFVVEADMWPNMIIASCRSGIPVGVINGRMSEKSAKRYKLVKPFIGLMLKSISFICAQREDIKQRYISLGAKAENIHVTGNIKYDMLTSEPARSRDVRELIKDLGWEGKSIVTCGSTHAEEETLIMKAAKELPDVKFILTPRHLERKKYIIEALDESGLNYAVLSKIKKNNIKNGPQVLLADAMGWLSALYEAATITFVGGSISRKGGHNFLEAAILKKPVLFGKYYYNTPDVADMLLETGGGVLVDADNFVTTVKQYITEPLTLEETSAAAEKTALYFKGATEKTISVIKEYEKK